jgi:hypothetical protein
MHGLEWTRFLVMILVDTIPMRIKGSKVKDYALDII